MSKNARTFSNSEINFLFILLAVLILQIIFLFLVFLKKETTFSLEIFVSVTGMLIAVIGWWATYFFGFRKSRKEIGIKEKLDIFKEIVHHLVNRVFDSYFQVSTLIKNQHDLENCDIQNPNDIIKKLIQDRQNDLINIQSEFQENIQKTFELFQAWKPLFSKKLDYESKFLFHVGWSFYEKVSDYRTLLQNYTFLNYGKSVEQLRKEKDKLVELEKELEKKSVVFVNSLQKFVLDMSKEVFVGLYDEEDEKRLFSLELENLEDGMEIETLTEVGIKKIRYEKTEFQKKFGSLL